MAIWQFKIELVPARWLETHDSVESLFTEDGYDVSPTWHSYVNPALETALSCILPPGKSSSAALTLWGSDQGDDIQLWRRHGAVNSIVIRFDLRQPNTALFKAVVDVVRECQLAILVPDLRRAIAADLTSLLRAAAESNAAHYVLDPHSYLLQADAANVRGM